MLPAELDVEVVEVVAFVVVVVALVEVDDEVTFEVEVAVVVVETAGLGFMTSSFKQIHSNFSHIPKHCE